MIHQVTGAIYNKDNPIKEGYWKGEAKSFERYKNSISIKQESDEHFFFFHEESFDIEKKKITIDLIQLNWNGAFPMKIGDVEIDLRACKKNGTLHDANSINKLIYNEDRFSKVSGLYFLFFKAKREGQNYIYIGESLNLFKRLEHHLSNFNRGSFDQRVPVKEFDLFFAPILTCEDDKDLRIKIEEGCFISNFNKVYPDIGILNKRGNPDWESRNTTPFKTSSVEVPVPVVKEEATNLEAGSISEMILGLSTSENYSVIEGTESGRRKYAIIKSSEIVITDILRGEMIKPSIVYSTSSSDSFFQFANPDKCNIDLTMTFPDNIDAAIIIYNLLIENEIKHFSAKLITR